MSDWDFLHDMHAKGYSADEIADAAACGYSPDEARYIDFGYGAPKQNKVKKSETPIQSQDKTAKALQAMEMLRQAGILTRPQFLACKAAILK